MVVFITTKAAVTMKSGEGRPLRRSKWALMALGFVPLAGLGFHTWRSVMQDLMHDATWYGTPETMQNYLRLGLDPNAYSYDSKTTVFQNAIEGRSPDMVRLLLRGGGDPQRVRRGDPNVGAALDEKPALAEILRTTSKGRELLRDYGVR